MVESTACLYLRQIVSEAFPVLQTPGHGLHRSGVGIYNGDSENHATGRAADIFLHADGGYEEMAADGLFRIFCEHGLGFGVDHVIWNRQIWSSTRGGPRSYCTRQGNVCLNVRGRARSPHRDHVHVMFREGRENAEPVAFVTYLAVFLSAIAGQQQSHGAPVIG